MLRQRQVELEGALALKNRGRQTYFSRVEPLAEQGHEGQLMPEDEVSRVVFQLHVDGVQSFIP